jgi:uroporphyrinogen-III synthase
LTHKVAYVGAPLEFETKGVVQIPVLEIVYQDLSGLKTIEGAVIFTSKRGILSLKKSNVDIDSNMIYCIGAQTSDYLANLYSLQCKVPKIQNSEGLAKLLIGSESVISLVASDQISKTFLDKMKANRIDVHHVVAYRAEENREADYQQLQDVNRILFGSSRSFEILYRNAERFLKGRELFAIGQPTEATMNSLGYSAKECFRTPDIRSILMSLTTKR